MRNEAEDQVARAIECLRKAIEAAQSDRGGDRRLRRAAALMYGALDELEARAEALSTLAPGASATRGLPPTH